MGYLHIDNLYKNQEVLIFKELYAMEKINGTSTHVQFVDGKDLNFSSGGAKYETFVSIFDQNLKEAFKAIGCPKVVVYGEAYGGKIQGMSNTYGKKQKFVAFDVTIDGVWLSVPQAEDIVKTLGLEFVHYVKISSNLDEIDREKNASSVQAMRNGMGEDKRREGVVLRPLMELTKNNGGRIIAKHKDDEFKETKTTRQISPERLKVLEEANAIAEEWVTEMRLTHILDKFPNEINVESIGIIIKAMVEDVLREGDKEIVDSREARKAIGKRASFLFKERIKNRLEALK